MNPFIGINQGFSTMTKAANSIKSTVKYDALSAKRAYGGFMNHMAGGGSVSSGLKGVGRDLMRDVGGKRLSMYGGGAALGAWGLSGD